MSSSLTAARIYQPAPTLEPLLPLLSLSRSVRRALPRQDDVNAWGSLLLACEWADDQANCLCRRWLCLSSDSLPSAFFRSPTSVPAPPPPESARLAQSPLSSSAVRLPGRLGLLSAYTTPTSISLQPRGERGMCSVLQLVVRARIGHNVSSVLRGGRSELAICGQKPPRSPNQTDLSTSSFSHLAPLPLADASFCVLHRSKLVSP